MIIKYYILMIDNYLKKNFIRKKISLARSGPQREVVISTPVFVLELLVDLTLCTLKKRFTLGPLITTYTNLSPVDKRRRTKTR